MDQLEIAQQELAKVGAALMKAIKTGEAAQLQVMPILKQLKKVNAALTAVINGEDEEFSFDNLDEGTAVQKPQTTKKLSESQQQDFGVDLGGFNDLLTPENDPDAFDWKATFSEANKTKVGGVDVDMGEIAGSVLDGRTLGRMVDLT